MALTAFEVKAFKPEDKTYRKFDGNGLYLEITPKGQKYWRYKYRFQGKEKRISLGVFPAVSLKDARIAHAEAKLKVAKGVDPSAQRKAEVQFDIAMNEHSFSAIALEWYVKNYTNKQPDYAKKVLRSLEKDLFPSMGTIPITMITASHLRKALHQIEERDAQETAHRVLQRCSRIFRYAIACDYCEKDPTIGLKEALVPPQVNHFPAILDPTKIGELLRAIDSYESPITRYALRIGAYTFVRPGNLRKAEWAEINLEASTWKIPKEKMKLRKPHIVPLATQVISILKELQSLTSYSSFVFPGVRDKNRPMSEATINAAFRRMGYSKEQMTGHGFRHMASTLLNEQGVWNPDAIERQLAHTDRSKIRGTYDHSKHIAERRKLMQAWADYLDSLKTKATVLPFPIILKQSS